MTLFSRRILQRLIDENASSILTEDQSKHHINRLNDVKEELFSFEWEVVILNVLNKVGRVVHEGEFGKKRPDVFFTSRTDKGVSFIADIVTVSDEGIEKQEPVKAFEKELESHISKAGLRLGCFSLHFNRMGFSPWGKKPVIKVPKRNRFHQDFFNKDFKNFLIRVQQNLGSRDTYALKTPEIDVWLDYNPHQRFYTVGLPANDIVYDLVKNPIYNALKVKAGKLREAEFEGTRGVIVCDGGSAMFHFRKTDSYSLLLGTDKVIKEFFRQNTSIAFVLLVFIETQDKTQEKDRRNVVMTELYENDLDPLSEHLRLKLSTIESLFPSPTIDARSAVSTIKKFGKQNEGWGFYTDIIMNGMQDVKISARSLLGLLAGTIKQEDFFNDYGFLPNRENTLPFENPFAFNLKRGRLIIEVALEQSKSEDDDYITFKFGEADAAISPFSLRSNPELAQPTQQSLLEGNWILQLHFADGRKIDLNLTITQDGNNFYGTLETEEGIAYLKGVNVLGNSFDFKLSSFTLNQQDFEAKFSGEVDNSGIQANLVMSSHAGTYFSFPVTGSRNRNEA